MFSQPISKLTDGSYMNRENRMKDRNWKIEGSPSIDGPNDGIAGGCAILQRVEFLRRGSASRSFPLRVPSITREIRSEFSFLNENDIFFDFLIDF